MNLDELSDWCPLATSKRADSSNIGKMSHIFHVNVEPETSEILRVIFSEYRESEDNHEKSIFLLFHQNIPVGELAQGKIV